MGDREKVLIAGRQAGRHLYGEEHGIADVSLQWHTAWQHSAHSDNEDRVLVVKTHLGRKNDMERGEKKQRLAWSEKSASQMRGMSCVCVLLVRHSLGCLDVTELVVKCQSWSSVCWWQPSSWGDWRKGQTGIKKHLNFWTWLTYYKDDSYTKPHKYQSIEKMW